MRVEIVEATIAHAVHLGPRLRQSDQDEVRASSGMSGARALVQSWHASDNHLRWTALVYGEPEVMFGAAGLAEDVAAAWLLASDRLDDVRKSVLVYSIRYVEEMNNYYERLTNWIDVRNLRSLHWLERLGFQPVDFCPTWGHERRPFIRYERVNV